MAETKGQQEAARPQGAAAAAAEATSRTTDGVIETVQRAGQRAGEAAERGAHAVRREAEASAAALRDTAGQSEQANRETVRQLGEAAERTGQAAVEVQRKLAHSTADAVEKTSAELAAAVEETARDWRVWLGLTGFGGPGIAVESMAQYRQGVTELWEGLLRTQIRAAGAIGQEWLRIANPFPGVALQRRLSGEVLGHLLDSSARMLHAARRASEQALQPLEERAAALRQQSHHQQHGLVWEVMQTDVRLASPDDTVQHAAEQMRKDDVGILPVGEGDRLVGMVTDRDVTLRLVAEGRDAKTTRVREVMSAKVRYLFDDETQERAAENMAQQHVRRLPVVNRQKRLVGIVSLTDLAHKGAGHLAGRALGAAAE